MEFQDRIYNKISNTLGGVFDLEIIIYYLSIMPLVIVVELFIVGWDDSSLKKITQFNKSTRIDIFLYTLDVLNIYNLITIIVSFGIFHLFAKLIYEATAFNLISTIDPPYIQFIILFLIYDLKSYVSHFIFHKYKTLWSLHEFHHSAEHFCIFTKYRRHFLRTALNKMIDVIPFAIFGSVETYLIIKVLKEAHQLIIHSSIKSDWGILGKYILVSPSAHRIHHSIKKEHYGKNFGITFIFWDRLFGTYQPHTQVEELGIEKNPYNKDGVLKDMLKPAIIFFGHLKSDVKKITKSTRK